MSYGNQGDTRATLLVTWSSWWLGFLPLCPHGLECTECRGSVLSVMPGIISDCLLTISNESSLNSCGGVWNFFFLIKKGTPGMPTINREGWRWKDTVQATLPVSYLFMDSSFPLFIVQEVEPWGSQVWCLVRELMIWGRVSLPGPLQSRYMPSERGGHRGPCVCYPCSRAAEDKAKCQPSSFAGMNVTVGKGTYSPWHEGKQLFFVLGFFVFCFFCCFFFS